MTREVIVLCLSASLLACVSSSTRQPSGASAAAVEPAPSQQPVVIVEAPPIDTPASADSTPLAAPDQPPATSTGIPECDSYLALYRRCEEYLMPAIAAGNRRFYHAEEASLVHYAGTPEAASMAGSCVSMHEQLQKDCPEQHRAP